MYYTVYRNLHEPMEECLKELKIDYEKKNASWNGKWGTHKFHGRHRLSIIEYFEKKGIEICFTGHSVYIVTWRS